MNRTHVGLALALLLASCNEASETPASPNMPNRTIVRRGPTLDAKTLRFPKPSPAQLAAATKAEAQDPNINAAVAPLAAPIAPHSPNGGMLTQCIGGAEGTGIPTFNGTSLPLFNKHGCELNTNDGDADPNNNAAFVVTVTNPLSGKKLTQVQRLDFNFAGGPPAGGAPRLSIPIDEDGDGVFETGEGYAFIDAAGCNDGDAYVGKLAGDDDDTCATTYEGVTYGNFSALEVALPGARIAKTADAQTFIAIDQPTHYLISNVVFK